MMQQDVVNDQIYFRLRHVQILQPRQHLRMAFWFMISFVNLFQRYIADRVLRGSVVGYLKNCVEKLISLNKQLVTWTVAQSLVNQKELGEQFL